jgi:spore maturation protein SpmA
MEWTPMIDCAYNASFTVGTTASNKAKVTVQLKDFEGKNLTVANTVLVYLASDSTGLTIISTIIGTEVAINTNGSLAVVTTKIASLIISTATGLFDVDLEDGSNKSTFYLVVVMPNGKLKVSGAVDLGD